MSKENRIWKAIGIIVFLAVAMLFIAEITHGCDSNKTQTGDILKPLIENTQTMNPSSATAKPNNQSTKTSASQSTYVSKDDEANAITMAQELVKKELKSPSTASFPWDFNAYTVTRKGDQFTVKGYVDAQNSFGAKLRNKFEACFTLEKVGTKYKGTKIYTLIYE